MLKTTGSARILDFDRKSVGFWMQTVETEKPVRVFVTYEALAAIDPSQVRDNHGALETFDAHRADIEAAAARKYAAGKLADFQYEGQAAVLLRDHDVT